MADVAAALKELDRMEGILRTRYHYPHPIFGHIAAARGHLADEPEAPQVHPEQPVRVEIEPATATTVSNAEADVVYNEAAAEESPSESAAKPQARKSARRKRGNA